MSKPLRRAPIVITRRKNIGKVFTNVCQRCGLFEDMLDGIDACHLCEECEKEFKAWHVGDNVLPKVGGLPEWHHLSVTRFFEACPKEFRRHKIVDGVKIDMEPR